MLRFPDRAPLSDAPDRRRLEAVTGGLDIGAGRVALAGSMAEYVAAALSTTPAVDDAPRQELLTREFLSPAIQDLERLLLGLRREVDVTLRSTPQPRARPYPLGWCREIAFAVEAQLANLDSRAFSGPDAEGARALTRFLAAGGNIRCAWGDLRGQYFQNALIVGSLYVDVANDSVVVTKPPIEILPFAEAGFHPIVGYGHFARIAERYWSWRFFPNHLVPRLAPYYPLIVITASGAIRLGPSSRYMTAVNLSQGFAPSERVLASAPMPGPIFSALHPPLSREAAGLAADPAAGRAAALAACRAYRGEGREDSAEAFNVAALLALRLNRRLARLVAVSRGRPAG